MSTITSDYNYLNEKKGISSWLFTLDHKRIGVMYLVSIFFFFLIGGLFALLLRTELLSPGKNIVDRSEEHTSELQSH